MAYTVPLLFQKSVFPLRDIKVVAEGKYIY
jgi:hypothetical protein